MLAESGGFAAAPRRVAVIVALEVERRCVRESDGVAVRVSGPGKARATAAAESAIAAGAAGLVSFGLAGGIAPDASPGRLLLPRAVLVPDGRRFEVDTPWRARIADALGRGFDVDDRPLLAADEIVGTPEAKARAAETGAAAVDLESGALAEAASRAGLPFVALRAVADGPRDALPPNIADWVDADGRSRLAPVVGAALSPSRWHGLVTLASRYGSARRTLERAASILAERRFLLE
ncbi:MAG: hypothetical protein LOD94_11845 [Gammaproteobacteria bacterium]|nr:hypothetical protein [Gammaproteobacteria bacterium]